MRINVYGELIYNEQDICEYYLAEPAATLRKILTESEIIISDELNLTYKPELVPYVNTDLSIGEFDRINQNSWFLPEEYKNMDIAKFVLDQCKNEDELQRAGQELLLYQERDMFMLLKYLKYLVDTMRKHSIVWGVGRGSSVSSFVLYIIGIHRINSLYYDLAIDEFLK
jgi:DNA polymerase III alpha subunit